MREQSAYGQGTSFAGVAAGGALSSMFWNPATMTQVPGIQSESAVSGLLPYCAHTPGAGSALGAVSAARQIRQSGAFVPASYFSYQYSPNLWFGLSINAPFGLSLTFLIDGRAGIMAAGPTNLKTYNATPSIAYRINDWLSVGAGVQIQYATEVFTRGLGQHSGRGSCHQRQWLGLRLHRRCDFHAYTDDYDWHWMALGYRSEIRLTLTRVVPIALDDSSGPSTPQLKRPTSVRLAFASASIPSGQLWRRRNGRTGAALALRSGRRRVAASPRSAPASR